MKKFALLLDLLLIFFFSLNALSAFSWVDDTFAIIETESPEKILHTIKTDYSLKKFKRNPDKENLLMAALKNARGKDVINLLLKDAKISPDSKDKNGATALMYACQYENDIDAIELVLFTGAKSYKKRKKRILAKDKNGQTCFDYAYKNENISTDVLNLLRAYADEPIKFEEEPLIDEFPEKNSGSQDETAPAESLEIKEAPQADKNSLLDFTALSTPLVIPESIYLYDYADSKYVETEIPKSLIATEENSKKFIADANRRDTIGRTKLMIAAKNGDIEKIENLLYSGAQIDARDDEGWTALMYAARFQKNPEVTKLLLYRGADRTLKNKYGINSLMLSAGYSESSDVVSLLLESYNPDSDEAREAFAYGISNYNKKEVLQAFIDKQVPVNIPFNGKTPLMLACQTCKNTEIIEWLLENGASKYQIEAATGKTAYDYAKENSKLPHNVIYWSLNPNS